jgi:hypothetical protein
LQTGADSRIKTIVNRAIPVLAVVFSAALLATADAADFERGKLLYSARCVGCHDKSVHQRDARKALTTEGIRAQVRRWDAFLGGAWREEEVNDVTLYLNDLFYRYPCPPAVCPEGKAALETWSAARSSKSDGQSSGRGTGAH